MRIESLKAAPDRSGRYRVRFDDGSEMRLYRQTVEDFLLSEGRELSDADMEALLQHAGQISARMRAVRIVAAASVSKRDLENRLVRKGEDPDQAREAVEWMTDLRLLDDGQLADQVVARCIAKGYGLARARQALYEKQIPKKYWDTALADYPDQSEKIEEFLRSRLDADSDRREVKKAIDALMRRGHSYGVIRRALGTFLTDSEEFPED